MNAAKIIQEAADAGIELHLIDGELRFRGDSLAVASFLPTLRAHKPEIMAALAAQSNTPPAPATATPAKPAKHVDQHDRIAAERAYHDHHFQCPTCIAAGQGRDTREACKYGLKLWKNYMAECDKVNQPTVTR